MNTKSILLAYATRYGSTREVAETITGALRDLGLQVNIQPMREVKTFDTCDAIVLGAAIYNARWHPDAHRFLTKHQDALRGRPVAIFALGPLSPDSAAMMRSRRQLDKELGKYSWLKPVALEVFGGKIDPSKLGILERSRPATDIRDWGAIRAWASSLPAHLQLAETLQPS